ncbi:UNVERIFIED_CONTAM: hypothetical protein FKN15_013209 [Acipenser sinensis]
MPLPTGTLTASCWRTSTLSGLSGTSGRPGAAGDLTSPSGVSGGTWESADQNLLSGLHEGHDQAESRIEQLERELLDLESLAHGGQLEQSAHKEKKSTLFVRWRVQFLQEMYHGTHFFYTLEKKKGDRKNITDDGSRLTDPESMNESARAFYPHLSGSRRLQLMQGSMGRALVINHLVALMQWHRLIILNPPPGL